MVGSDGEGGDGDGFEAVGFEGQIAVVLDDEPVHATARVRPRVFLRARDDPPHVTGVVRAARKGEEVDDGDHGSLEHRRQRLAAFGRGLLAFGLKS